jgi:ComF family protein
MREGLSIGTGCKPDRLGTWKRRLDTLAAWLLPQDCHLCALPSAGSLLCDACLADLPQLPVECCPVCALPAPGASVCGECLRHPPHFDATHAAVAYGFPVDRLVQAFKYGHQLALAGLFARLMQAAPPVRADLIIPLPLSAGRLRERGFNQALEIARLLATTQRTPLDRFGTSRISDTVPQASLPWKQRRANVRHAFECSIDLSGKSIMVVDDVMTTGASLDEFAKTLKYHGAACVTNWVFARTLKHEP